MLSQLFRHSQRCAAVLSVAAAGVAVSNPVSADDETRYCQLQAEVTVQKQAEPHAPMQPGLVITYILTATNNGASKAVLKIVDDMSATLDDSFLTGQPVPSAGTVGQSGNSILWDLALDPAASASIKYSVTIKPWDQLGDGRVRNAITAQTQGAEARSCQIEEVLPPKGGADTGDGSLAPGRTATAVLAGFGLAGVAGLTLFWRRRKPMPAYE